MIPWLVTGQGSGCDAVPDGGAQWLLDLQQLGAVTAGEAVSVNCSSAHECTSFW